MTAILHDGAAETDPDIVVCLDQGKDVLLMELTAPWEEPQRKMTKYDTLLIEIKKSQNN